MRDLVRGTDVELLTEQIVESAFSGPLAEHRDDVALVEVCRAATHANVDRCRRFIADGLPLDHSLSTGRIDVAAMLAERQLPETTFHSGNQVASRLLLLHWVRGVIERSGSDGVTRGETLAGMVALQAAFFEYQDFILARAIGAFKAESQTLHASKADLRQQLVRAYLAGESALGARELADALRYPVGETHLAILLTGVFGDGVGEVTKLLHAAAAPVSTLVHPVGLEKVAIWCAKPDGWRSSTIDTLQRRVEAAGMTASFGGASEGVEGLRASFDEAMSVEAVRSALATAAAPVMRFDEVRLEAFALGDLEETRRFVRAELGALADRSETSERLRETLMAWFATGSHVSAGAQLGVHEHTVRNRIRRAEEIVGRPLTARRTEMQVGLRLHRLLAGDAPPTHR
jgi:hypothetical protein